MLFRSEKAHAQVAMSYTLGDAYTLEYWKDLRGRYKGSVLGFSISKMMFEGPDSELMKIGRAHV